MQELGRPREVHAEYEFTGEQNTTIGDLASKMRFVGLMGILFGLVLDAGGIYSMLRGVGNNGAAAASNIVTGFSLFIVGIWTRSAATRFQKIVDTQGSDIANLMEALGAMRRIYTLQRALFIIVLLILVLGIQMYFLFVSGH